MKGRPTLEDLDLDVSIIVHWSLSKSDCRACTGLIWLRIGKRSFLLVTGL